MNGKLANMSHFFLKDLFRDPSNSGSKLNVLINLEQRNFKNSSVK